MLKLRHSHLYYVLYLHSHLSLAQVHLLEFDYSVFGSGGSVTGGGSELAFGPL